MSTGSIHHRAKHRSRARRLALPAAVVFGLTLAVQWSNPFDSALWSPAHAGEPSRTTKKVVPRVVDFNKQAKQKAEARQLLDAARKAAARGDFETARRQADQAAAIPVEWNLGETSPKKFLDDLQSDQSDSQRYSEPIAEVTQAPIGEFSQKPHRQRRAIEVETPNSGADREVIEISFPEDRPGLAETSEEDLSSLEAPPALKVKREAPSRLDNSDTPKPSRTQGHQASDSATSVSETNTASPRTKQRFASIPSLEELAEPARESDSPASQSAEETGQTFKQPAAITAKRSTSRTVNEPQVPALTRERASVAETTSESEKGNRAQIADESAHVESHPIRRIGDDDTVIPAGRIENTDSDRPSFGSRSQPSSREFATPATPTTVIHEIRVVGQPASADQATNLNSNSASQVLANFNSFLMAGLFGALVLLIVIAVVVLRKFGPNPQFTFKVEVSHPDGIAAVSHPVANVEMPPVHVTPTYALKRQMEEDLEHQQEDAMMRQVFEENLKLREQLEDTRIAA